MGDVPGAAASRREVFEQRIRLCTDGPYQVVGVPRLSRASALRDEEGHAHEWIDGPQLDPGDRYELCRCGGSHDKPFCDGTHRRNGFDGTPTADRGPSADRRREYPGEGVVMTDDRSLCSHAKFCTRAMTDAWRMTRETDDPSVREELIEMIQRCPSGRLQYAIPPSERATEQATDPEVVVIQDGPLWVRGGIRVETPDGEVYEVRARVTLCRCGRSSNKPFCDGSHEQVGFKDG